MTSLTATQIWWGATLAFVAAFAAALVAQAFDRRRIGDQGVWIKPTKFALSLAIHFATLALIGEVLGPAWQASGLLVAAAIASTLCGVLELAYIAIQAGRRLPSHFHVVTPVYAALYAAMALGAVVILVPAGLIGVIALIDPVAPVSPPLRTAIAAGLIGGTVLTLITAFRLGGNMSNTVGVEAPGAARMPLTGWSLTVGDLRPAHFLATHMMQAVPLVGLIAARTAPGWVATLVVWGFAAGWTALTLIAFQTALSGHPTPFARP